MKKKKINLWRKPIKHTLHDLRKVRDLRKVLPNYLFYKTMALVYNGYVAELTKKSPFSL